MTTTTRQLLNQEEQKLYRSLFKVYNRIQQDLDNASWGDIQAIYHKTTDDIIRSGVTAIYEISARKTVERDIHVPYFLTQQDLAEIKRMTQKYQDSFWLSLNREVTMRNQMGGVKTKYDPVTLLLVRQEDKLFRQGFISRISSSVHGEAAASAVLSKARQVVGNSSGQNFVRRSAQLDTPKSSRLHKRLQNNTSGLLRSAATAAIGELNNNIDQNKRQGEVEVDRDKISTRSLHPQRRSTLSGNAWKMAAVSTGAELVPHITWRTADMACEDCAALEGTQYLIDDPDIPIPSEDLHPRCRCELILEDAEMGDEEEITEGLFF